MTPTATERLVVAVVATLAGAIAAVLTGAIEIAVLATAWTVLLALGLANSGRPQPRVGIEVMPDRAIVGDRLDVTAEVTDVAGTVRAAIQGVPGKAETPVASVATAGRATLAWSLDDLPWGTHDLGRLDLHITEPYGLVTWRGRTTQSAPVRIHPDPGEISELLGPHLVRRTIGNHPSASIGRGVEYADLRQYQAGDSVRDINWRVSARSQDLWVSECNTDRATDVILLLDSFAGSGRDATELFRLAVEATMTIAEQYIAATDRVGLVELGGIVRWIDPRPGRHQLHRLIDTLLSTTQYDNAAEKDLAVIPPRALPPRSFVIALSPLTDRRFVDSLFVLAARGHDIAVIECPPAGTQVDEESPAMRTARRLWEAERGVLRDQLTTSGVATVEWRHGERIDIALFELRRRRARVRRMGVR